MPPTSSKALSQEVHVRHISAFHSRIINTSLLTSVLQSYLYFFNVCTGISRFHSRRRLWSRSFCSWTSRIKRVTFWPTMAGWWVTIHWGTLQSQVRTGFELRARIKYIRIQGYILAILQIVCGGESVERKECRALGYIFSLRYFFWMFALWLSVCHRNHMKQLFYEFLYSI